MTSAQVHHHRSSQSINTSHWRCQRMHQSSLWDQWQETHATLPSPWSFGPAFSMLETKGSDGSKMSWRTLIPKIRSGRYHQILLKQHYFRAHLDIHRNVHSSMLPIHGNVDLIDIIHTWMCFPIGCQMYFQPGALCFAVLHCHNRTKLVAKATGTHFHQHFFCHFEDFSS